ncbi:MAG: hypothetical protein HQL46_04340 [Gammaproteobacteria bacterium]|nr:hypothetical protein [Gammaproteobacteria bacterium]
MINNKRISILSVLSYLGPLCFVPLMNRDSEFVHFHAKQGLVLWAISNLLIVFMLVPFLGGIIIKLFSLTLIVMSTIGIANVLRAREANLPLIGFLAHHI